MSAGNRAAARARSAAAGHSLLHLGCGQIRPTGWLNVDGSWSAKLQAYPLLSRVLTSAGLVPPAFDSDGAGAVLSFDVRQPLPWESDRFEAIYASHLLEHLTWAHAQALLAESRRVLKPGGVLRIVVPDLEDMVAKYTSGSVDAHAGFFPDGTEPTTSDGFILNLGFVRPVPRGGGPLLRLYDRLFAFHYHKWMYDERSLIAYMERAGFTDVRRCEYLDSGIATIAEVERESRITDSGLCVEGVVPTPASAPEAQPAAAASAPAST